MSGLKIYSTKKTYIHIYLQGHMSDTYPSWVFTSGRLVRPISPSSSFESLNYNCMLMKDIRWFRNWCIRFTGGRITSRIVRIVREGGLQDFKLVWLKWTLFKRFRIFTRPLANQIRTIYSSNCVFVCLCSMCVSVCVCEHLSEGFILYITG